MFCQPRAFENEFILRNVCFEMSSVQNSLLWIPFLFVSVPKGGDWGRTPLGLLKALVQMIHTALSGLQIPFTSNADSLPSSWEVNLGSFGLQAFDQASESCCLPPGELRLFCFGRGDSRQMAEDSTEGCLEDARTPFV